MADYRIIIDHVRYWRGKVHRWSTSYSMTGNGTTPDATACGTFLAAESKLLYPGDGASRGGPYECRIYLRSGGVPVATFTKFNWQAPAEWVAPSGEAWSSITDGNFDDTAEDAVLLTWEAGLSKTGKPVFFRHYYHAIPFMGSSVAGQQTVPAAVVTNLQSYGQQLVTSLAPGYGLVQGNANRLAGTSPVAGPYVVTHQMPRGRKRPIKVTANGVAYRGEAINSPGPVRLSAD